jgi:hypothetical protein
MQRRTRPNAVGKQQTEPLVVRGGLVRPIPLCSHLKDAPGGVAGIRRAFEHYRSDLEVHRKWRGAGKETGGGIEGRISTSPFYGSADCRYI